MTTGSPDQRTLFLAGDVMTGRGIDQILAHPSEPELLESFVKDARQYVELADRTHGPVPAPVAPSYVFGDGLAILARMKPDFSLVNLETSVTRSRAFWPGKPVHYRMHPRNIACLLEPGIDVCALANNHLLDFGRSGLVETLEVLHGAGIATAGAGRDLIEACRPARFALGGGARVWVFAFGSETSGIPPEWAAAPSRPGVHLLRDLSERTAREIAEQVRAHKGTGDLAIASVHWGSNWGYGISAASVDFAHTLVDGGVDVVHGHSSHHVRSIEVYRNKLILYGAGDLITDYEGIRGKEAFRGDLGVMYFATLSGRTGRLMGLRLVPMQMKRLRLTRATRADARWLRDTLNRVSEGFGARFDEDEAGLFWTGEPDLLRVQE